MEDETESLDRYGRHSKSVNIETHGCGLCQAKLKLLERVKKDGTPVKPNAFALYIKVNRLQLYLHILIS